MKTNKAKVNLLVEILMEVHRLHSNGDFLFTCNIVENKYGYNSQKTRWYQNLISTLPKRFPDLVKPLFKSINAYKKIENISQYPLSVFKNSFEFHSRVPFNAKDLNTRVVLLTYLINHYAHTNADTSIGV